MKKIILFCVLVFIQYNDCRAQLKSGTSEIFELSSIVFRLAGAEEYMNNDIPEYAKDIDEYFAPHSGHNLIEYIREIRQQYYIGYDAVTNAAATLVIRSGEIAVKQDFDISEISGIDNRWTAEVYSEYLSLLNDFYKASEFNKFYTAHASLYDIATKRLDDILSGINTEWFSSFFGEELDEPLILSSLCNGRGNYAFLIPGQPVRRGIIIGSIADDKGLPTYWGRILYTIMHELSHGFTNKLLSGIWDDIDAAAGEIFPYVQDKMLAIAYGYPETVMIEWFNNLCTNMYFRENPHKNFKLTSLIGQQQRQGFIWMERSVGFMDQFYENRDTFVTIKDYMPALVAFINDVASDFEQVVYDFNHMNPYITEISPFLGSSVSKDTDRIVIKFSEPMFVNAYGYGLVEEDDVLPLPLKNRNEAFWQDDTTFVLIINKRKLQKGQKYGLTLNRFFFQSMREYSMAEDFVYYFTVAD